jgi:hypothetical protein
MAVDKRNGQTSGEAESRALREDELENYGVWVKTEPSDILEFPDESFDIGMADLAIEESENPFAADSSVKDESFLSLEEETLLDSLEAPVEPEPPADEASESLNADFSVGDLSDGAETGAAAQDVSLDAFEAEEFALPDISGSGDAEGETYEPLSDIETVDLSEIAIEPAQPGFAPADSVGDEFSIPDFSISDADEKPGLSEESFDTLLDADATSSPASGEAMAEEPANGEEELSLEDFGLDLEEITPPEKPKPKPSADGTSEVSLDDFLDADSFNAPALESSESGKEEELEPIEMDLDFDDSIDSEPLSIVHDRDAVDKSFEDTINETEDAETGPVETIDTELVTDFDEFISADSPQQIVRPAELREGSASALAASEDFIGSGTIEDASLEDQTDLVTEADSLEISLDGSDAPPESERPSRNTAIFENETNDVLANIENMTDDSAGLHPIDSDSALSVAAEDAFSSADSLPDIDLSFGDATSPAETPLEPSGSPEAEAVAEDFDDMEALERSLIGEEDQVKDRNAAMEGSGASSAILLKIADELSTIKSELASLKSELSSIRAVSRDAPAPLEASAQSKTQKGFFDEEEDETIALTGDELDNILNTADFTEETGASITDADDQASLDDIIPLDLAEEAPQAVKQAPPSLRSPSEDKGLEDLKHISEVGVSPMTEAPDDTSYLEEPIGEELENMTIADTPLEEPDLSDFIVSDNVLEDAGFPGDEAEEGAEAELGLDEEILDDITLDLDSSSNMSPDMLAEDQPLEDLSALEEEPLALPDEDDGDDFVSEISLADDTLAEEEPLEELQDISLNDVVKEAPKPAFAPEPKAAVQPVAQPKPAPKPAPVEKPAVEAAAKAVAAEAPAPEARELPVTLKNDIKSVLQYMDRLLESLPEDKIEEFAHSEHFGVYKKLFEELGLL